MIQSAASKFSLGQLLATPGALDAIRASGQSESEFLKRHSKCDWGQLSDEDRQLNDEAVVEGGRILSAYQTSNGTKLWIITEAADDQGTRSATTILLPEEY